MAEIRKKGIMGSSVYVGAGTRWGGKCSPGKLDISLAELPDFAR